MDLKYKYLIKNTDTNELRATDTIFRLGDNTCYPLGSEIVNQLFGLNIFDINKKEVFQGDILKITYQDRSSYIFQKMKEEDDDVIYMFLTPDEEFLRTIASFNDEVKYFATNEDTTTFLRYISKIECFEIVGNIYNDSEFVKSISKTKEEYDLIEKKENLEVIKREIPKFIDIIKEKFTEEKHYFPEEVSLNNISLKSIESGKEYNSYNDYFQITLNIDLDVNIDFENYKYDFVSNNYNDYMSGLITELYDLVHRKSFEKKYPDNEYKIFKSSNQRVKTKPLLETKFNEKSDTKQSFELIFLAQIYRS